jgi:hypothetical protein
MRPYDFLYCIGDSFTYAMGQSDDLKGEVTVDNRWSQLVADHLHLKLDNRAVAGTNNHWIARTLQDDMIQFNIDDLNPLVIVMWSDQNRTEVWDNEIDETITLNADHRIYKDYVLDHFNWTWGEIRAKYHSNAMRFMLNYMNIDFVEAESCSYTNQGLHEDTIVFSEKIRNNRFDEGRGHLNVLGNKLFAETIINRVTHEN